ncbi:MAG: hypothetical protein CVT88_01670 [Candidatus Altiarchaeales archaeon HGW-Altiarchaeales-1]|nr:MAG: hypothetical protein CVT88_01670 [Candidatus Altiarchaeales archaeon HGW-Altiarchaeales-1]
MNEIHYYVIDSCSLIDLKKMNPPDIYEKPWNNIEKLIDSGRLFAPKQVFDEICQGDDELKKWVQKRHKKFIRQLDEFQIQKTRELQAEYPSWVDINKETEIADPFIVALAMENDNNQRTLVPTIKKRIVVTQEKLDGNKIKIPFICKKHNIESIEIFDLFRKLAWKF